MSQEQRKVRVLVVEDSPLVADQVRELLQEVTSCATPIAVVATEKEAVLAALDMNPDLVILDLHLKQGTGFGVLKALSAKEFPPTIAVLTNYALPKYRDLARLRGAHYFLDKALDFDRLPGIVEHVGQSRESRLN
ncbi:MAG: response regulator [Candidatus Obscuribacterales bacterium]|nr:response regulator [Steroidobacteraceae bacterium]